jgi:protein TonB
VERLVHVKYPPVAKAKWIMGAGVVRMKVRTDGSLERVEIGQSSASPILDAAAVDACKQWRFKPGAVVGWVRTPFYFSGNSAFP